jgi:hypothetical protein
MKLRRDNILRTQARPKVTRFAENQGSRPLKLGKYSKGKEEVQAQDGAIAGIDSGTEEKIWTIESTSRQQERALRRKRSGSSDLVAWADSHQI